jgi:DNA-binding transcriptional ArsR family regulator
VNTPKPRAVAELEELDAIFSALAHRTRRAILLVLHAHGGQLTSGAIAGRFDCSWPTTTRHLHQLEEAGLVKMTLHGRERTYQLDTERLHTAPGRWLERFTTSD